MYSRLSRRRFSVRGSTGCGPAQTHTTPAHRQRPQNGLRAGRLTRRGTSLLIMSCTTFDSELLLEKLTRYFKLNVRLTCAFISTRTPSGSSSSSSFFAFFAGFPLYTGG